MSRTLGSEEHPSAPCPKCGHGITIAEFDVDRGEIFACPACGLELEVLGFEPLRLVVAEPAEEDL